MRVSVVYPLLSCCFALVSWMAADAQVISRSFELRYFSDSTKAIGTNGFQGDSSLFDLSKRLDYLTNYATYAKAFFENPRLDQQAVLEQDVVKTLANIKDQPMPKVRHRLMLEDWNWHVGLPTQHETDLKELEEWKETGDVRLVEGKLYTMSDYSFAKPIERQNWRFSLEWETRIPQSDERSAFVLLDDKSNPIVLMGITAEGGCFYKSSLGLPITCGQFNSDTLLHFKVDVDVESGRFSMYLNGEKKANFVKVLDKGSISKFFIKLPPNATLDDIYGISYTPPRPERGIYATKGHVFINQDFEIPPDLNDWMHVNYQDGRWGRIDLPLTSGEWFRESDLYLRKNIAIGKFQRAVFHSDYLTENTEIWLNGKVIHVQAEAAPLDLDVTRHLKTNERNLIALRLRAGDGWAIGKSWFDLTEKTYVQDVYTYTKGGGDTTQLQIRTWLRSEDAKKVAQLGQNGVWKGIAKVEVFTWLPYESPTPVISQQFPVSLRLYRDEVLDWSLPIRRPLWWSPESPNLYKVVVSITDSEGAAIDDFSVTTGVRTVHTEGGVFNLNNVPTLLTGGNLSNYPAEPENRPKNPADAMQAWLVRAIQMVKNVNGNTLRTESLPNLNQTMLARLCDQLGIMVVQQTTTPQFEAVQPWETTPQEFAQFVQRLRNHPSIIMWQAADNLAFTDFESDALPWMDLYYRSIFGADPSRLISLTGVRPSFGNNTLPNDDGTLLYGISSQTYSPIRSSMVWTANKVVRGNAEQALNQNADWKSLDLFPLSSGWDTLRMNYLTSKKRAYFDFEGEATTGRTNPMFIKGSLYYPSEFFKDRSSALAIGAELNEDQWEASQAWQAFSTYEALRKKRWLGYDGLLVPAVWNGGDPAALVDGAGYAKLAYYTTQMGFQQVLAGSKNVDLVYGPNEQIPVFVSHWGKRKAVEVRVIIKNMDGNIIKTMRLPVTRLPEGNLSVPAGNWTNTVSKPGWYIIEYEVTQQQV